MLLLLSVWFWQKKVTQYTDKNKVIHTGWNVAISQWTWTWKWRHTYCNWASLRLLSIYSDLTTHGISWKDLTCQCSSNHHTILKHNQSKSLQSIYKYIGNHFSEGGPLFCEESTEKQRSYKSNPVTPHIRITHMSKSVSVIYKVI